MTYLCSDSTSSNGMPYWTLGIEYETTALTSGTRVRARLYLTVKYGWYFAIAANQAKLTVNGNEYGNSAIKINQSSGTNTYILVDETIDISHSTAKTITLTGDYNSSVYWTSGGKNIGSYSTQGNLSFPARTSSCGAPTYVGDNNNSLIIYNGSRTLSWHGATGGTNNTITGYTVFYRDNAYPTTSTYTGKIEVSSASTSASCTIYAPARGVTRYFKVLTKGSAGSSYYSGLSSDYDTLKANSLPAAPSVSVSSSAIPSSGGTVTFTVTPGADSDGQSCSVWYSDSSSGDKNKITDNSLSVTLSTAKTYYFWTNDGMEYSASYTSKSITKNTKPVISNFEYNDDDSFSVYSRTAITNYSPYLYSENLKFQGTKDGTIKIFAVRGDIGEDSADTFGAATSSLTSSKVECITKTVSANTNSIISFRPSAYKICSNYNQWFRIGIEYNDGVESVFRWLKCKNQTTSQDSNIVQLDNSYSLPPAPEVTQIYNQHSNSNIEGTTYGGNTHFYKDARVLFDIKDIGTSVKITAQGSSSYSTTNYLNDNYVDVTYPEIFTSGETVTFSFEFINAYGVNFESTITKSLIQTKDFNIQNIIGLNDIKVFTDTETKVITGSNPMGGITDSYFQQYDLDKNECFSVIFKYNNKTYTLGSTHSSLSTDSTNTTLEFNLKTNIAATATTSADYFYNTQINTLNFPFYSTKYPVSYGILVTNRFGKKMTSYSDNSINFDFVENPKITTSTSYWLPQTNLDGDITYIEIEPPEQIFKGLKLKIKNTLSVYSSKVYTIRVKDMINNMENQNLSYGPIYWISSIPNPLTPIDFSDFYEYIVPEISTEDNASFTFSVFSNNGQTQEILTSESKPIATFDVLRQTSTNILLSDIKFAKDADEKLNLYFKYTCSDLGGTNTSKYDNLSSMILSINLAENITSNGSNIAWKTLSSTETNSFSSFIDDTSQQNIDVDTYQNSSYYISVHTKSINNIDYKLKGSTTNAATPYKVVIEKDTPRVLVYSIVPTVSYRKNCLGINHSIVSFDSNTIMVIEKYEDRNKIILKGIDDEDNTIERIINIENGRLEGFILDGGTWDSAT